jgi:hypothetical protein
LCAKKKKKKKKQVGARDHGAELGATDLGAELGATDLGAEVLSKTADLFLSASSLLAQRSAPAPAQLASPRAPRCSSSAARLAAHRACPGRPPRAALRAPQTPRSSPRRPAHRVARGASSTAAWPARAVVLCGRRRAGSRRPPEVIFFNFQFVVGIFLLFRLFCNV